MFHRAQPGVLPHSKGNSQILPIANRFMDNVKNEQNYGKTIITFVVLTLGLAVALTTTISNVDAAPKDPRFGPSTSNCTQKDDGSLTCCWREPIPGSILGQKYCQTCNYDGTKCGDKEKKFEQIKTPGSTRSMDVDEQISNDPQTVQPSISANEEIVFEEDITEQNSEKGNSEPNSGLAESEQSSSFANKGNSQTSSVPPECPKQGPIPPDCTMKPKF